jgi:NhaP-type Na+/H+ or K+/H+ antiporter
MVSGTFLQALSIIALILVLFDAISKIRFGHFDSSAREISLFFFTTLIANLIIMSYAIGLFFGFPVFASVVFSLLISCIEFSAIFPRSHSPKNKLTQLLKDESVISCAFILLIPFLILMYVGLINPPFQHHLASNLFVLFLNLVGGIGMGLLVSLVLYKLLHFRIMDKLSYVIVAVFVFLAYVLAQRIQGTGLIAVATMALIFGNILLRHKRFIDSFFKLLDYVVEILMFIIVGMVIPFFISWQFFAVSLFLFVIYLLVRISIASITLGRHTLAERFEIALFIPKGLATITAAFALLNYDFIGSGLLVSILVAFFVYSLVFDTVLDKLGVYTHR